jgi:hypothetical protein
LTSIGLPKGSRKNIVHCSPGWPSKRRCGFQHEVGAGGLQALCHRLPVGQRQDEPEMRHRHPVLADMAGGGGLERLAQVQGDLVAEEVEIDPGGGAAALLCSPARRRRSAAPCPGR